MATPGTEGRTETGGQFTGFAWKWLTTAPPAAVCRAQGLRVQFLNKEIYQRDEGLCQELCEPTLESPALGELPESPDPKSQEPDRRQGRLTAGRHRLRTFMSLGDLRDNQR